MDVIDGGLGDDLIDGGGGGDSLAGGVGDDTFVWNPGGGSDVVDGGPGRDSLIFSTTGANEIISVLDFGGHAFVTGGLAMDLTDVETLTFRGDTGGSDIFFIGDLGGTDVRGIEIALGHPDWSDGQVDTVNIGGGPNPEHVVIRGHEGLATVRGLSADLTVRHGDPTDRLVVRGLDGGDSFDASGFGDGMTLVLDGGRGDDRFVFAADREARVQIMGFEAHGGAGDDDLIVLRGFSDASFDEAVNNQHIVQAGADVVIADGSGLVVTLRNFALADLGASDFLFA